VNVTEIMVDAEPQEIITNDNLNARVDAQVYFKVNADEQSVKASQYNVFDYRRQIVNLARATLRNIIGTMTLKSANSERGKIRIAAVDFATATETVADGARRAEIKKAEGIRQAKILEAEGEAQAIALVNEAADRYFVGNARLLKRLEVVENALATNAKVVVPAGTQLVNVIGELAGVLPLPPHEKKP